MGSQRKALEHRGEKKVGAVQANRDSVTGCFAVTVRPNAELPYKTETVERVKALAEAPASGEAVDAEAYLRWLNG
ncbi:hypothetical protein JHL17_02405 [Azospirillum sp. YIM B02556]|uniref:Uncharacterized protein n=1 Tax=Azospirillum endophyticum TaxID=2800326 RepID=A0ABS1EYR6_9PROT|nr:hypothetical protein [Azospirillum endophyticum]MBK1836254.1 hypothetical protein [Azospirillum endophyticum]